MSKDNTARNAADEIRYRFRVAHEALTALNTALTDMFHADRQVAVCGELYGWEHNYGPDPMDLQAEAETALRMLMALASQQVRLVAP